MKTKDEREGLMMETKKYSGKNTIKKGIEILLSEGYISYLITQSKELMKEKAKYMLQYKPNGETIWRTVSIGFTDKDNAERRFDKIKKDFLYVFNREEPDHRVVPIDISARKGSWKLG